jgi:hypothetical protein
LRPSDLPVRGNESVCRRRPGEDCRAQLPVSRSPKAVAENVGRIVVEEEFTGHGVWIFNLTLDIFGPAALDQWPVLHEDNPDAASTSISPGCSTVSVPPVRPTAI